MKLAFLMKNERLKDILVNAYMQLGKSSSWHNWTWLYCFDSEPCHPICSTVEVTWPSSLFSCTEAPCVTVALVLSCYPFGPPRTRYYDLMSLSFSLGDEKRSSVQKAVPSLLTPKSGLIFGFLWSSSVDMAEKCIIVFRWLTLSALLEKVCDRFNSCFPAKLAWWTRDIWELLTAQLPWHESCEANFCTLWLALRRTCIVVRSRQSLYSSAVLSVMDPHSFLPRRRFTDLCWHKCTNDRILNVDTSGRQNFAARPSRPWNLLQVETGLFFP